MLALCKYTKTEFCMHIIFNYLIHVKSFKSTYFGNGKYLTMHNAYNFPHAQGEYFQKKGKLIIHYKKMSLIKLYNYNLLHCTLVRFVYRIFEIRS